MGLRWPGRRYHEWRAHRRSRGQRADIPTLAYPLLEKFGGDHLDEVKRNAEAYAMTLKRFPLGPNAKF